MLDGQGDQRLEAAAFVLQQQPVARLGGGNELCQLLLGGAMVGPREQDDGVLSLVIDLDDGVAAGPIEQRHSLDVDPGPVQGVTSPGILLAQATPVADGSGGPGHGQ